VNCRTWFDGLLVHRVSSIKGGGMSMWFDGLITLSIKAVQGMYEDHECRSPCAIIIVHKSHFKIMN
jgi:hypothetical protein